MSKRPARIKLFMRPPVTESFSVDNIVQNHCQISSRTWSTCPRDRVPAPSRMRPRQ